MNILVSNDDGIFAQGLWSLVQELMEQANVFVVAPDREQSGVGTAITMHHPLRVQRIHSPVLGIDAYSVCGTPGDSVILGIRYLIKEKIDLVISGINTGPNVGDDVLLSGTVGAALQGYLHGISAIAVSLNETENRYITDAARVTAKLIFKISEQISDRDGNYFLNINIPASSASDIKGIKVTTLNFTGLNEEILEGHDGRKKYYWIKHQKVNNKEAEDITDAGALASQFISVTPLHIHLFKKQRPELDGKIYLDFAVLSEK